MFLIFFCLVFLLALAQMQNTGVHFRQKALWCISSRRDCFLKALSMINCIIDYIFFFIYFSFSCSYYNCFLPSSKEAKIPGSLFQNTISVRRLHILRSTMSKGMWWRIIGFPDWHLVLEWWWLANPSKRQSCFLFRRLPDY